MTQQESLRILCDNIRVFSDRGSLSTKQRNLCLAQLIDRFLMNSEEHDVSKLYKDFCRLLSSATYEDKALFCQKLFCSRHASTSFEKGLFGNGEGARPGAHGKVALVRNRYNEEAFSLFSHVINGAKITYSFSFVEACEDVMDGRCEFCILPIENTHDGKLFGFYSMLDRYELKICAGCDLETENPSENTRYALVGKSHPDRIPKEISWNLECSVATEIGHFPKDILRVAPIFDATLLKIDSLPVLYDDGSQRFYFTFRLPQEMAPAFDLYLSEEHSRYIAIGYYPLIEPI